MPQVNEFSWNLSFILIFLLIIQSTLSFNSTFFIYLKFQEISPKVQFKFLV